MNLLKSVEKLTTSQFNFKYVIGGYCEEVVEWESMKVKQSCGKPADVQLYGITESQKDQFQTLIRHAGKGGLSKNEQYIHLTLCDQEDGYSLKAPSPPPISGKYIPGTGHDNWKHNEHRDQFKIGELRRWRRARIFADPYMTCKYVDDECAQMYDIQISNPNLITKSPEERSPGAGNTAPAHVSGGAPSASREAIRRRRTRTSPRGSTIPRPADTPPLWESVICPECHISPECVICPESEARTSPDRSIPPGLSTALYSYSTSCIPISSVGGVFLPSFQPPGGTYVIMNLKKMITSSILRIYKALSVHVVINQDLIILSKSTRRPIDCLLKKPKI
ncbi:hypothetical protein VP01_1833g1 [Puccinia sorghi]|uniref:Uncharacterized protein n=1 Tax=Puccinia sorghi TaxID=27349 RepID=A0A0L6VEE1_9BASI|nr:hypothetical protein VP01_1833g1 [Puccinia sorghi]